MTTEQELYDKLTEYYHNRPNTDPATRPSFLVVFAAEDDDSITTGAACVDPDIPETITGPPLDLTMAQQTVVYAQAHGKVSEAVLEALDAAKAISYAVDTLGRERLMQILAVSDGQETFSHLLEQAIKQAEVERHGTG